MITDSPDIEIKDEDKEKVYDDLDIAEETQATKQIVLTDFTECDIYNCCDMPRNYAFKKKFLHVNTVYY